MRAVTDAFHDRMELRPEESLKVFLFAVKALSAMGFLFVLGHITATGTLSSTTLLVLGLAAVLDLLPELVTVRIMDVLPPRARQAERLQLGLTAAAYAVLAGVVFTSAVPVFTGYAVFIVLWLASFLVEESVMFLVEDAGDR
ncbi:MAG: hypothetical protein SVU88_04195 [Candidatus Nanohaloarchaea archaeon]|nr:hypothetical protein [Candidatus Nanohaloarchaea archaeon]